MFENSYVLLHGVGEVKNCQNHAYVINEWPLTILHKIVFMSHRLAAFHSHCQWARIFLSLANPMAMRTQLAFKRHRESRYLSQCPRETVVSTLLSANIFTGRPSFMGARGAAETIHITESKIQFLIQH